MIDLMDQTDLVELVSNVVLGGKKGVRRRGLERRGLGKRDKIVPD